MTIVRTYTYGVERRTLLKAAGGLSAAALLPGLRAAAATSCEDFTTKLATAAKDIATIDAAKLFYWIDGLHFGSRTDLTSRANVALYLDDTQAADDYTEAVLLVGPDGLVIGAQYFDATQANAAGMTRYVLFENVQLDATATYQAMFLRIKSGAATVTAGTIAKPVVTNFSDILHRGVLAGTQPIPVATTDQDFGTFLVGGANVTPGLVTTPFQYYTHNGLTNHSPRARLNALGSDGSFSMAIDFMHADAAADHYMRYFLVLDPVGRLLGVKKRSGPGDLGASDGALNVSHDCNAFTTAYGIPANYVGDIRDCPYVHVMTDDSYDCLAKTTIRLR